MAKRPPKPEPTDEYIRDEAVHIPTGETRFTIDLDEQTVEELERGVCPESLANRMHELLAYRREAFRVDAREKSSSREQAS